MIWWSDGASSPGRLKSRLAIGGSIVLVHGMIAVLALRPSAAEPNPPVTVLEIDALPLIDPGTERAARPVSAIRIAPVRPPAPITLDVALPLVPDDVHLETDQPAAAVREAMSSGPPANSSPLPPVDKALENSSWQAALLAWVREHKTYPPEALSRRLEGTVVIRFLVQRSGYVEAVDVTHGSGYSVLDIAAADLLQGKTVPRFPDSMPQRQLWVELALRYSIDRRTVPQ